MLPATDPRDRADAVIVGAGMAGIAAALWGRRLALRCAWLEAGADLGGQLARINGAIPDYPGLDAPDGRAFREALRAQLAAQGLAPRLGAPVAGVDLRAGAVRLADGTALATRAILVATGVAPRRLGVPGEEALRGRGVTDSATRDRAWLAGRDVAVVGGGDGAVENALILAEAGCRVTLIHRGAAFRARPDLAAAAAAHPAIAIRLGAAVAAIEGADAVGAVRLADGDRLAVSAVVVKAGVAPVLGPFAGLLAGDPAGYPAVDAGQRTSAPGVFAAGDVCNPRHSSLAAAAGQAMVAMKEIAADVAAGAGPWR